MKGHFDGVVGRAAIGWAVSDSPDETKVEVEFLVGEKVVASCVSNTFRQDLIDHGISSGFSGFKCLLPLEVFQGGAKEIIARIKGTDFILYGSPRKTEYKVSNLKDAFTSESNELSVPLTDYQVTLLHSVLNICETLSTQNKMLSTLASASAFANLPSGNSDREASNILVPNDGYQTALVYEDEFKSLDVRRDIIVFSIIDWGFRMQRPQHIAKNLARLGHRIIYISVHLKPKKSLIDDPVILSKLSDRVYDVSLKCQGEIPSMYAGIVDNNQLAEVCSGLNQLIDRLKIKSPISILQYPTWLPVAKSVPGNTLIFDCMDHLAGFSTASQEVIDLEHQVVMQSDAVITTSKYLEKEVSKVRRSSLIRNAAEIEFFSANPKLKKFKSDKPLIGYYGAIAEWFDSDLILKVVKSNPHWNFMFVGATDGSDVEAIRKLPNATFTGEVSYNVLPDYLYSFDCCLIPFKLVELIKATNPVKIYEYLAAGKPVVATRMPELELIPKKCVYIADNAEGFTKCIRQALGESKALSEFRRSWVIEHSWFKRARDVDDVITEVSPKISVIVLCYNGLEFTRACLDSIDLFTDYPNLELICVDNASSDGTNEFLFNWCESHSYAKLITNGKNLGFAEGNNVGIKAATGEYVVLLNNDTYVTKGWLKDLIAPMARNKKIGMIGPVTNMIGNEQKVNIHYADMNEMAINARSFVLKHMNSLYETNNLAFFCVAMPAEIFREVGLLDPIYGMGYFEDDDYSRRVLKAGYKIYVNDSVFVHHHLSASFDQIPQEKKGLMEKNKKIFEDRWGEWKPHGYRNQPGFG